MRGLTILFVTFAALLVMRGSSSFTSRCDLPPPCRPSTYHDALVGRRDPGATGNGGTVPIIPPIRVRGRLGLNRLNANAPPNVLDLLRHRHRRHSKDPPKPP